RGVCIGKLPCIGHLERSAGHGGPTTTTEADIALSLCYVSKVLFHPVLDCVVTCLVTLIPRCNGQKCL
ncbi:hypothetical protein DBR06_SOUSAS26610015, partial [Sousa chinensis]